MAPFRNLCLWLATTGAVMLTASTLYWFATDPGPDTSWVAQLYRKKTVLLNAYPIGPRIILAGGSSVHFGYSAELISSELGVSAFNAGSHASLGPRYHLFAARRMARPGDCIVLAIEYENFRATWRPTDYLKDYVRWFDPDFPLGYEGYFSPRLLASARFAAFKIIGEERIRELRRFLLGAPAKQTVLPDSAILLASMRGQDATLLTQLHNLYDMSLIDAWGDQTGKIAALLRPELRVQVNRPAFDPEPVSVSLLDHLARAQREMAKDNIRLLIGWPPYLRTGMGPAQIRYLSDLEKRLMQMGFELLGYPQEYLFDASEALDTRYHPTQAGATRMTSILISQLRRVVDKGQCR